MWEIGKRYEAIEVDGKWYVIDHKHPDAQLKPEESEDEAKLNARVWNLLVA